MTTGTWIRTFILVVFGTMEIIRLLRIDEDDPNSPILKELIKIEVWIIIAFASLAAFDIAAILSV